MITNYFKIALRRLWANKGYTLINSIGLATGISIFAAALIYINYEKSYDKWDGELADVYRAGIRENVDGSVQTSPSVQFPLGTQLINNCPEIALLTRVQTQADESAIGFEGNIFFNRRIISADSNFFAVFPYRFYMGSAVNAMKSPQTVVITRAMSEKIFGHRDPIGKVIKFNNKDNYTVSGVIEKTGPSHLNFDFCIANNSTYFAANWFMQNQDTYVKLKPNAAITLLRSQAQRLYLTYNKLIEPKANPQVFFEPVSNIHLNSEAQSFYTSVNMPVYDVGTGSNSLTGLMVLGAAILLLSCVNYTNMAIAKIGKRAKESGIRKILGASRKQVIFQFLVESLIQTGIAALLAMIFTLIFINVINKAFMLQLTLWSPLNNSQNGLFISEMITIVVMVSLISGLYPAFLLSGFTPVKVLKGNLLKQVEGLKLQSVLIIFQYGIATCFIVGILIVSLQLHFMRSKDPGFNTDQVLRIQVRSSYPKLLPGQPGDRSMYVTNGISAIPGVKGLTMSDSYPGQVRSNIQQASLGGKNDTLSMRFNFVSFNYVNLLQMHIKAGRDFSMNFGTDSINAALINETAAQKASWKNAIGKRIKINNRQYEVIGVLDDTYLSGFQSRVLPEIYAIGVPAGNFFGHSNILVKVQGNKAADVLSKLNAFWKTVDPDFPMRYTWVDQDFAKLMEKDERLGEMVKYLTFAAVILAGIGILSLSAYTAEQRTKEIGIRKVLGASVSNILGSFFLSFLKLVLMSIIIAFPLAWIIMNKWLQEFAYHIKIEWWMFLASGVIAILIAAATVAYQALKAAMANPINSLSTQ